METDQNISKHQPGASSTTNPANPPSNPQEQDGHATKLEQVRRMKEARRAVDAYVNNLLYEMMRRAGIEIPREELEQGFEEFCRLNTGGLRVPDHLREFWNGGRFGRPGGGPSEE
uniref:Uncharacterized protein n=1 Tax=Culex tarsalis TaxID=7177 RepID=A0A1Q3EV68_CULTA